MLNKLIGASVLLGLVSSVAVAGECDIAIEATASMAFSAKEITINKTCKEVSLTLKNAGNMPKAAMGHNLVITKKAGTC